MVARGKPAGGKWTRINWSRRSSRRRGNAADDVARNRLKRLAWSPDLFFSLACLCHCIESLQADRHQLADGKHSMTMTAGRKDSQDSRRRAWGPVTLCAAAIAGILIGALPGAAGGGSGWSRSDRASAPPGGLDGYTTGLGLMDVSSDEYYRDDQYREVEKEGMPVEMKKMIVNAEDFHRRTMVNPDAQDREDERRREKELELPQQRIPRKIWQVSFESHVPKVHRAYSDTWSEENEEYLHTLCSAAEARSLVEDFFPELLAVYDELKQHSRQDFFMYLVLFKFGGVFATIDSTCELPLRKLVKADDDMIVGHQPVLTSRILQRKVGVKHHSWPFHQWVLASAQGHPVLRFMIEYIAKNADKTFARDNDDVDSLLRSGAAPFNDAITAFRRNPVVGNQVRLVLASLCCLLLRVVCHMSCMCVCVCLCVCVCVCGHDTHTHTHARTHTHTHTRTHAHTHTHTNVTRRAGTDCTCRHVCSGPDVG